MFLLWSCFITWFFKRLIMSLSNSLGTGLAPIAQPYKSHSSNLLLISASYFCSCTLSNVFKYLSANVVKIMQFSSMPLFLDWYIRRLLIKFMFEAEDVLASAICAKPRLSKHNRRTFLCNYWIKKEINVKAIIIILHA